MHNGRECEIRTQEGREEVCHCWLFFFLFFWEGLRQAFKANRAKTAGPAGVLVGLGFQGSFHDKQQWDPSPCIDYCTAPTVSVLCFY